MIRRILKGLGLSLIGMGALCLVFSPSAYATGGSDSATPYSVTAEGISLPAGQVFRDNGHVNIRYMAEGVGIQTGLHFEAKCIERTDAECAGPRHAAAQFIGKSFIPWSAFSPLAICVEWVQIDFYNEHYGEGGQPPVGPGCTTPTPTPTPTETVTPTPEPTPTVTPEPTPEPTPSPTVTPEPTPTPEPTVTPTAPPTPTPEPSVTPTTPPVSTPEPTVSPSTTPAPVVPAAGRTAPPSGTLAVTGSELNPWAPLAGGILVAVGCLVFLSATLWHRRRNGSS